MEEFPSSASFEAPFPITYFNNAPRFGHTVNLAGVITGSEAYRDYVQGISFIGGFILFILVLWIVLLVLFMCCGRTVGILSGRRFLESQKDANAKRQKLYRGLIIFFCFVSVFTGILFLTRVGNHLDDSFTTVRTGITSVADRGRSITEIADLIIKAGEESVPIRDSVVSLIEQGICNSFDGGNGASISIDPIAQEAVKALTMLSDYTKTDFTTLRNQFDTGFVTAEMDVNGIVDRTEGYAKISYYATVVVIFSILLAGGTYFSMVGRRIRMYFLCQTWVIVPVYFIFLVMTAIVTSFIGAALVLNSDACMGSAGNPESFVRDILDGTNTTGFASNPYAREAFDHYILNGCEGTFKGQTDMINIVDNLKSGLEVADDLKVLLDNQITTFEAACGGEAGSLGPVSDAIGGFKYATISFVVIGENALRTAECEPINKIYTDFSHEGVCRNMPDTLYWMFITMMLVLVSGMAIFTLRGALLPSINDDEPDDYYYTATRRNKRRHAKAQDEEDVIDDIEIGADGVPFTYGDERSHDDDESTNYTNRSEVEKTTNTNENQLKLVEESFLEDGFDEEEEQKEKDQAEAEAATPGALCGIDAAEGAAATIQKTWRNKIQNAGDVCGKTDDVDDEVVAVYVPSAEEEVDSNGNDSSVWADLDAVNASMEKYGGNSDENDDDVTAAETVANTVVLGTNLIEVDDQSGGSTTDDLRSASDVQPDGRASGDDSSLEGSSNK